MDNIPYSEPVLTNEQVYSDEKYIVRKLWTWNVKSLHEDRETGLLKVLISGSAFNWDGKSVFATIEGKRLTELTFDVLEGFHEGLAKVGINGYGYGFVDKDMNFVIPMKYNNANDFRNGIASVKIGDRWIRIDNKGNELQYGTDSMRKAYQLIGEYSEGLCPVSTLSLAPDDSDYYSDYEDTAGMWGFINEEGEEVISPQYIYAHDFQDGIAIVAKGKWTKEPNRYGRYQAEEELWGAIDKSGNEVIPFIFDEIRRCYFRSDILMAHYGAWKDGKWGVIDTKGNWLTEPVFSALYHTHRDNLIVFYDDDPFDNDDALLGIYDIEQRKVLFEPQFLSVEFCDRDEMLVEVFDRELGRTIEKIIDRSGKERFKSIYSTIYTWRDPYEVSIRDENGDRSGLIDRDGNEILPCIYDTPWRGFCHEHRRICYKENGKQGIMDYDGNIIVPPIYYEIHNHDEPFLTVRDGEYSNYKEGLITPDGKTVIPARYEHIGWYSDRKHFFCCSEGCCEMYIVEDRV